MTKFFVPIFVSGRRSIWGRPDVYVWPEDSSVGVYGCGGVCACGLRNDLCIGGVKKGNIMDTKKKCAKSSSMAGQPSVDSKNEYRNGGVVTQLTPDDLMTDESFRRSGNKADGTPTDQQLNQEVTALNPSVESMDGRG